MVLSVTVCLGSRDNALASHDRWLDLLFPITRPLLQNLIILIYSDRILVSLLCGVAGFLVLQLLDRLVDDLHQVLLKLFLLDVQAIFIPDEVGNLGVPAVLLHAALEEAEHKLVVGVLSELELATVVHEFTELLGVVLAQLVYCYLELLLLDVVVLFVLGTPRETLPRESAP